MSNLEGHSCGPDTCVECGEQHGCICGNCEYTFHCECDGCWACTGHETGCTCDVDWDKVYGHNA